MHINYNRLSRAVWISDDNGRTVARAVTPHGGRCIDTAGELLAEHGFVRTGDYLLAGSGSPIREATIRPLNDAEHRLARNPETLAALHRAEGHLEDAVELHLDFAGRPL